MQKEPAHEDMGDEQRGMEPTLRRPENLQSQTPTRMRSCAATRPTVGDKAVGRQWAGGVREGAERETTYAARLILKLV